MLELLFNPASTSDHPPLADWLTNRQTLQEVQAERGVEIVNCLYLAMMAGLDPVRMATLSADKYLEQRIRPCK